jgi:hypothetical protein
LTTQPTQQDFLDGFQDNHERFLKLINHLNEEQQQIAFTPEGWSVKDFISHMSHWKAATLKLIVAYTHYQPLPPVTPLGNECFCYYKSRLTVTIELVQTCPRSQIC